VSLRIGIRAAILPTVAAIGLAGSAGAGPLTSATLQVQVLFAWLVFPGASATGTATNATSATLGASGGFEGTQRIELGYSTPPPPPRPFDTIEIAILSGAAGSFTGAIPGKVGGQAGFGGSIRLIESHSKPSPFLTIPFKLGKQTTFTHATRGLAFSIFGAPWTVGPATIDYGNVTSPATVMVTGRNALGPSGAGILTLVSPSKILNQQSGAGLPLIGILTLTYVPEPSTGLLLAAGALGLGALGRRHAR
jgi:hypothetical protein